VSAKLPQPPPEVLALTPYQPGKPIEELERELGISGAIKLASNENPLGPSPKALEAMRQALSRLHRYPDGAGFELRTALAEKFGVRFAETCIANGSDEIIEFLARAYIRPGQEAVAAAPSFLMYSKLVQVSGGRLIEVPLKDYRLDLAGMLAALTPATRLVFVNNPDNPAGTAVTMDEMRAFLKELPPGVLAVLDEAYIDFATDPQVARGEGLLAEGWPVVMMRTFSKSAGLAGLRIGYAVAPAEVVAAFDRVRQPFNTSIVAQEGALAALEDHEFLAQTRALVARGLAAFYDCFKGLDLFYVPSQANFVLVRIGPQAAEVADRLLRRGVIVRHMGSYGMPDFLRISVGLDQENQRFIGELTSIVGQEA